MTMRRQAMKVIRLVLLLGALFSMISAEVLQRRARTKSSSSSDPSMPTLRRVTTAQKRPRQEGSSSGAISASASDTADYARGEVEPSYSRATRLRSSVRTPDAMPASPSDWGDLDDLLFAPDASDSQNLDPDHDHDKGKTTSIAVVMDREKAQTSAEKEKVDANVARLQIWDDYVEEPVDPFYLDKVPDTLAGQTYKKYEARYWFMKQNGMQMPKKFFAPERSELANNKDRAEFQRYAERFKTRLPHRVFSHTKRNRQYKLKRFGPKDKAAKTGEQMRETRQKSLRDYLSCRMKRILGMKCAKKTGGTRWTKENEQMMRELNMMTPLAEEDPVMKLYNKMMNSKGMGNLLPSPPTTSSPASSPDHTFIAAEPSQDSSGRSHGNFGDPTHHSASDSDEDQ